MLLDNIVRNMPKSYRRIINPMTGRKIQVGGPVYKELRGGGVEVDNRRKFPLVDDFFSYGQMGGATDTMPIYHPSDLSEQEYLANVPYKVRRYEKLFGT